VEARHDGDAAESATVSTVLPPAPIGRLKLAKTSPVGMRLVWRQPANTEAYDVLIARDRRFTDLVLSARTTDATPSFVTEELAPTSVYFVKVRPVNRGAEGRFTKPVRVKTRTQAVSFRVAGWNVCSEKCNDYSSRAPRAAAVLAEEDVDVFALQEAGGERVGATTRAVFSGGPREYAAAPGGGNSVYLFYRPALFTPVDGGNVPVGYGRTMAWAKLRLKETGQDLFVVSVHLLTGKDEADGKRRDEAETLLTTMRSVNPEGLPVVYAGDFNSGVHRGKDSPGTLMDAAGLVDARFATENRQNERYNSGHSWSPGYLPASGAHVDHVWVSPDFRVDSWKQIVRLSDSRYATPMLSDHNAISALLSLEAPPVSLGPPTQVADNPPAPVAAPTPPPAPPTQVTATPDGGTPTP